MENEVAHKPPLESDVLRVEPDSVAPPVSGQKLIALSKLTGEFLSPALEKTFCDDHRFERQKHLTLSLLGAAFVFILFSYWDFLFLGIGNDFYQLLAARLTLLIPAAFVSFKTLKRQSLPQLEMVVFATLLLATAIICFSVAILERGVIEHAISTILVSFTFFLFFPIRFRLRALAALALSLGFLMTAYTSMAPAPVDAKTSISSQNIYAATPTGHERFTTEFYLTILMLFFGNGAWAIAGVYVNRRQRLAFSHRFDLEAEVETRKATEAELRATKEKLERIAKEKARLLNEQSRSMAEGATKTEQIEEELRRSEGRIRRMMEQAADAITVHDLDGTILEVNKATCALLGYDRNQLIGENIRKFENSLSEENFEEMTRKLLQGEPVRQQGIWQREDGSQFPVEANLGLFDGGDEKLVLASSRDITRRTEAERKARKLSQAVEQSPVATIITDSHGRIEYINKKCSVVSEYDLDDVVGKSPSVFGSGLTSADIYEELWETISSGKEWRGEFQNRKKTGATYWVAASVFPIFDTEGEISNFISVQEDMTLRKEYEKRLEYHAYFDLLTGLPNRVLAYDRLIQAISRAQRQNTVGGLMSISLDHFKRINESLGHATGDQILMEVSSRLHSCLRDTDTVARTGGDEFAAILPDIKSAKDAEMIAEKILDACSKPYLIKEVEAYVTASIGITTYPKDAGNPDILMQYADAAMFKAKESGRSSYVVFTPEMDRHAIEHLQVEAQFRRALDRGELELHYQPLVEAQSGRIVGAEALLRWKNPTLGDVSPSKFIPLAESTGLIIPIGNWVIEQSFEQAKLWAEDIGDSPFYISINISAKQLIDNGLVEFIQETMQNVGMNPQNISLEITEGVLVEDTTKAVSVLNQLSEMGFKLAIDDFGTGYSSLSYLHRFPFDILKIDRCFVPGADDSESDKSLVSAIIAMASSLGLRIISEGVETQDQLTYMQDQKCDLIQGFFFSKPLNKSDFGNLLHSPYLVGKKVEH